MASNIFISYRRADTEGYAGRIYDRLSQHFGEERIFMDVNDIRIGQDFIDAIGDEIIACQIVIVLIGPQWLSVQDAMGQRRLDDPHDFVRQEVASALNRDILVIPVLVNGATMPKTGELPPDLASLARRNAFEIHHRHFESDMAAIIKELADYLECSCDEEETTATTDTRRPSRPRNLWWLLPILGVLIVGIIIFWRRDQAQKEAANISASQTQGAAQALIHTVTPLPPSETPTATQTASPTPMPPTATTTPSPTLTPTITWTPSLTPYPSEILDSIGIRMVFVPEGTFTMGTNGRDPWDIVARPTREITLSDFYIDKYEVSNAQYARCVDVGVCAEPSYLGSKTRNTYYNDPEFANYPVIYVSWYDAQAFCNWRGGRLPSEAEWEKAARGSDQRAYPWGDEEPDCQNANYMPKGFCAGDTIPVTNNSTGASPYGAYNMSGNVAEWVRDWFQAYPEGDLLASKEFGLTARVLRGGAYFDSTNNIKVTVRKALNPGERHSYLGFRCVIDPAKIP